MQRLRPISILSVCLIWTASAAAQISLAPPAAEPAKPAAAPKTKPPAIAKKPPAPAAKPEATPAPAATATPAPAADDPNVDLVYGAYQRGMYKTAFDLATQRAQAGDPKAMTMLGELYANALGVKRDFAKAAAWYKRACRCRRPRSHVRTGDDAAGGPRRPAEPPGSSQAAGIVRQTRQPEGGL